jgi:hypothetical protein
MFTDFSPKTCERPGCPRCRPEGHRGVIPTPEQRTAMRQAIADGRARMQARDRFAPTEGTSL